MVSDIKEFIFKEFENLSVEKMTLSFLKIGNGQVVENLFLEIIINDLLESHHLLKFGSKR